MTAEQNIIAAAVQLAHDNHRYLECVAEFDHSNEMCEGLGQAWERAIEQLDQALKTAGIDVRDLAVWDTWRKGQGFVAAASAGEGDNQ